MLIKPVESTKFFEDLEFFVPENVPEPGGDYSARACRIVYTAVFNIRDDHLSGELEQQAMRDMADTMRDEILKNVGVIVDK